MAVSFFPNWVGQRQVRLVELNGEHLQLSTDGPQRSGSVLEDPSLCHGGAPGPIETDANVLLASVEFSKMSLEPSSSRIAVVGTGVIGASSGRLLPCQKGSM